MDVHHDKMLAERRNMEAELRMNRDLRVELMTLRTMDHIIDKLRDERQRVQNVTMTETDAVIQDLATVCLRLDNLRNE